MTTFDRNDSLLAFEATLADVVSLVLLGFFAVMI